MYVQQNVQYSNPQCIPIKNISGVDEVVAKLERLPSSIQKDPELVQVCVQANRMDLLTMLTTRYLILFFYGGGWNTERILNSYGNPLFGFPMVFHFEQNGGHFVKNPWKFEQNGRHFVWIHNGSVFQWLGR